LRLIPLTPWQLIQAAAFWRPASTSAATAGKASHVADQATSRQLIVLFIIMTPELQA
jgi:hypothetical protein